MSGDVEKRVVHHNTADSFWTKRYKNWKIIYKRQFPTHSEARKWELYLKKQKGGNGLKNALLETNEL
jgi:predicted GIY-YIG superfamily endonuclease